MLIARTTCRRISRWRLLVLASVTSLGLSFCPVGGSLPFAEASPQLLPVGEGLRLLGGAGQHMKTEKPTPEPTPTSTPTAEELRLAEVQAGIDDLTARYDATVEDHPELAGVDSETYSGGAMSQTTGAPTGETFGRVTPSRLRGGGLFGGGMQGITDQLLQQALFSLLAGNNSGGSNPPSAPAVSTTPEAEGARPGAPTPDAEISETVADEPTDLNATVASSSGPESVIARPKLAPAQANPSQEQSPYRF